jgi:hypothetical protein
MTTAARPFPIIPLDDEREPTEAEIMALHHQHNLDLVTRCSTLERKIALLERDLRSARVRNSTLVAGLRRATEAPTLLGQSTVNGVLTLVYSNGRILRHEPTCIESADSVEYSHRWVEAVAPETPLAVANEALAEPTSDDDDDTDDGAFDPTFRALAVMALAGARA